MLATWGTSTGRNPTLDLQFAGATSLDNRITFSRGSQATLFDSTGALVYAKHNLLLQSQTFDNASWTKTRSSVTQDTAVAPDGTTTADSLVEDGTAANTHDLRQSVTNTGTNTWALSVYFKAVNRSWAVIEIQNTAATSNRARAWFDLQNGVVGTGNTAGSGVTYVSHSIQNVGNGWYRCILVGTADSAVTSVQAWLEGTTADNVQNYNGVNGQTSVYIWGAQLNLTPMEGGVTSSLSTYYPTVASAYYAPRFDYNPSTLAAQGLLIEEQRTNLLLQSGWAGAVGGSPGTAPTSWTIGFGTGANTTLVNSIYGTSEQAVRFDADATERIMYQQAINVTNGVQYALSVFVEAASGPVGDVLLVVAGTATVTQNTSVINPTTSGRYTILFTATGTGTVNIRCGIGTSAAVSGTCSITMSRPQVEAGAFATSYIPTTTTALTRNADVASMTGTNFSSWFNAAEGTIYSQAIGVNNVAGATRRYVEINDNTANERFIVGYSGTTNTRFLVTDGGATQADVTVAAGVQAALTVKITAAYKVNDFQQASNGTLGTADTSGNLPTVDRMFIGQAETTAAAGMLNGWVQRIAYYPVRLPDSTLQALTA